MNRNDRSRVAHSLVALVTILTASLFASSAGAEPAAPSPANRNAAVQYWQAFALLPVMNAQERQLAGDWQTTPLNAAADKLIQASAPALIQLHRGSICNRCDWGLNKEDSFNLRLPHLVKARELARLAFLRARQRLSVGQTTQAIDDIIDTLILARRAGADDILIGILVQASIEQMAVDAIAPHLATFNKNDLAALSTRIAQLPPGGSIQGSVVWEREYGLLSLIAQLKAAKTSPEPWEPYLSKVLGLPIETIHAAGGTPQSLAENLEKLRPIYDEFPAALKLPHEQARARLLALKKQADANPLKTILPDFSRFYDRYAAVQTRLILLQAAIAILQDGPDQLKNFPDPYTQQAIVYTPGNGNAFTLTSTFTEEGKPVTLTVGPIRPHNPAP